MWFFRDPKIWKSHRKRSELYYVVPQRNFCSIVKKTWATFGRALSCNRKIPSHNIPDRLDLMAGFHFCKVSTYSCVLSVAQSFRKTMSSVHCSQRNVIMTFPKLVCTALDFFFGGESLWLCVVRSDACSPSQDYDTIFYHLRQYCKCNDVIQRDQVTCAAVMPTFCSTSVPPSGCFETRCAQILGYFKISIKMAWRVPRLMANVSTMYFPFHRCHFRLQNAPRQWHNE